MPYGALLNLSACCLCSVKKQRDKKNNFVKLHSSNSSTTLYWHSQVKGHTENCAESKSFLLIQKGFAFQGKKSLTAAMIRKLFFNPLFPPLPSVSLSAMRGPSELSSVSGLVTTMEVRGVTKLYCRDISRALAVALSLSSVAPLLLQERKRTEAAIIKDFHETNGK